jgi:hypothetical protein
VPDAAVDLHRPVGDPGLGHVRFEGEPLLGGGERVGTADAQQHAAGDVAGVLRPARAHPGMEAHDRLQVGTRPAELETHRRAEAEPDRGDAVRVRRLVGEQDVEPGATEPPGEIRITGDRTEQRHCRLDGGHLLAVAEVVEGERHIPQTGESLGPLPDVLVEAATLVAEEHGRSFLPGGVVPGEVADHPPPLDVVLDVFDVHRRILAPAERRQ